MIGALPVLALALALALADPPAPVDVLVDLGAGARTLLQAKLDQAQPGGFRLRPARPLDLARLLHPELGAPPVALVGFGASALVDLARTGQLEPMGVAPASACVELSDAKGNWFTLWIDPLRLAFDDEGGGAAKSAQAAGAEMLPKDAEDLCYGPYEGRLVAEHAQPGTATAAFLAYIAGKRADIEKADDRLAGFDANVEPPYAIAPEQALARLLVPATDPRGLLALSSAQAVACYEGQPGEARRPVGVDPFETLICIPRAVAIAAGQAARAAPLRALFDDPRFALEIARAEGTAALSPALSDADVGESMTYERRRATAEMPRLRREIELAVPVCARYQGTLIGSLKRKQQWFEDWYDTAAIAGMAALLFWLLKPRRK